MGKGQGARRERPGSTAGAGPHHSGSSLLTMRGSWAGGPGGSHPRGPNTWAAGRKSPQCLQILALNPNLNTSLAEGCWEILQKSAQGTQCLFHAEVNPRPFSSKHCCELPSSLPSKSMQTFVFSFIFIFSSSSASNQINFFKRFFKSCLGFNVFMLKVWQGICSDPVLTQADSSCFS